MNDAETKRWEMQVKVVQFYNDNQQDFSTFPKAQAVELGDLVTEIEAEAAAQQAGFGEAAQQFEVKDTARENLRDQMSAVSRTAKSMEYQFDGISDKFHFRRNSSDAQLLAKGRAFHSESAPYEADFIDYDMPSDFRDVLNAACDAFEASFSTTASATAEHVAATAGTSAKIRKGMIIVRTIDGPLKNKYANNPGKLAAWISASHVEKAPQPKDPPTP